MKASRYNLYVENIDRVRVISLLTGSVVEMHSSVAAGLLAGRLSDLPAELVAELATSLILVPERFDERAFVLARTAQARRQRDQLSLIVVPTLGCNLSCHYCFEAKRDESLSDAAIERLDTSVAACLGDYASLHIQWFGGEPLRALPQIEGLSVLLRARCAQAGKAYGAEIVTNGVLLTDKTAQALASWGVGSAQVTFDGDARLHDRVRFGTGRAPTFDVIVENVAAASAHLKVKVRIHVAPYSVDNIFKLLDQLAERKLTTAVDALYFAPIFNYSQEARHTSFSPNDRRFLSASDFARVQASLLERAWALGFRSPDPLSAAHGICAAASQNSIVVNADGSLTKCYMDVGDRTEAFGDATVLAEALAQSTKWSEYGLDDAECLSCTFLPICLGGCPKQKMEDADKAVICTPLRYNYGAVLGRYNWRSREACGDGDDLSSPELAKAHPEMQPV